VHQRAVSAGLASRSWIFISEIISAAEAAATTVSVEIKTDYAADTAAKRLAHPEPYISTRN